MSGSAAAVANAVYHSTGIRTRELPIRLEKRMAQPAVAAMHHDDHSRSTAMAWRVSGSACVGGGIGLRRGRSLKRPVRTSVRYPDRPSDASNPVVVLLVASSIFGVIGPVLACRRNERAMDEQNRTEGGKKPPGGYKNS
jgi:hypothetical protein